MIGPVWCRRRNAATSSMLRSLSAIVPSWPPGRVQHLRVRRSVRSMRRMWAGIAVVGAGVTPARDAGGARRRGGPCSDLEPVELGGTVTEPRLIELSGLAASRRHPGVLVGPQRLRRRRRALRDARGRHEPSARTRSKEPTATDWEDMAVGPGPGRRPVTSCTSATSATTTPCGRPSPCTECPSRRRRPPRRALRSPAVEAIELTYPDGPVDAEALLVDPAHRRPRDRDQEPARRVAGARGRRRRRSSPGAPVPMVDAGGLPVPAATEPGGGPARHHGHRRRRVAGRFARRAPHLPLGARVRAGRRPDRSPRHCSGEPCFGPQEEEPQGEAIAFTGDGAAYVTASEGANVPIHRVGAA